MNTEIELRTHHSGDVFTVVLVYVVLQADSDQSFQGRGAEVKQGGEAMVGCVLQVRKGRQRSGVPVLAWAAAVPEGPLTPPVPAWPGPSVTPSPPQPPIQPQPPPHKD